MKTPGNARKRQETAGIWWGVFLMKRTDVAMPDKGERGACTESVLLLSEEEEEEEENEAYEAYA